MSLFRTVKSGIGARLRALLDRPGVRRLRMLLRRAAEAGTAPYPPDVRRPAQDPQHDRLPDRGHDADLRDPAVASGLPHLRADDPSQSGAGRHGAHGAVCAPDQRHRRRPAARRRRVRGVARLWRFFQPRGRLAAAIHRRRGSGVRHIRPGAHLADRRGRRPRPDPAFVRMVLVSGRRPRRAARAAGRGFALRAGGHHDRRPHRRVRLVRVQPGGARQGGDRRGAAQRAARRHRRAPQGQSRRPHRRQLSTTLR